VIILSLDNKTVSSYEKIKTIHGRVHVHHVMKSCQIAREEAVLILQKLKSKGYVGGNAKDGYWITSKEMPKTERIIEEKTVEKVFRYLEDNRETKLSQIAKDLKLSVSTVKEILSNLEIDGRIKLQS
jgi:Mn-dependent DtxR family transcriptional regulator